MRIGAELHSWILLQIALYSSNLPFVEAAALDSNLQRCLTDGEFDPAVDYFPDKFELHETTDLLSITYHNSYKIIHNKYSSHNKTYLLYQCGAEEGLPSADELAKHHLVLPVPHTGGIAVSETPQITPLELLGKRQEIKGYFGDVKFVSSPCLDYMIADPNSDVDVVFDANDAFRTGDISKALEQEWVDNHPNAIVYQGTFQSGDGARDMTIAASQEKTNKETFDWIGYHAALFNLEKKATQIAAATKERYSCSRNNAVTLSADMSEEEKPTLLWAWKFEGYDWSVAECPTVDSVYYCEYADHCGAKILSRPEDLGTESWGYWYLSDEEFLQFGKDADHWIFPQSGFEELYKSKKDLLDQFKSVQNKQVYDTQGKGGTYAWNEQRLSEYDVVSLDFCEVVGLSNPNPPLHVRTWFRNVLAKEDVAAPEVCTADQLSEPYVPKNAACNPISAQSGATLNEKGAKTSGSDPSKPFALISNIIAVVAVSLCWFAI